MLVSSGRGAVLFGWWFWTLSGQGHTAKLRMRLDSSASVSIRCCRTAALACVGTTGDGDSMWVR